MSTMNTGIQLYSLRNVNAPLSEQIEISSRTGFDGVEFAGLKGTSVEQLNDTLTAESQAMAGAHVGIDELTAETDTVAATYNELGADYITIPGVDQSRFESADQIDDLADEMAALADDLAAYDLGLAYHNHNHEFTDIPSAGSGLHYFMDATDDRIGLQIDIGWAAVEDYDPATMIDQWGDRMYAIHVKDVQQDGQEDVVTVPLGDGILGKNGYIESSMQTAQDNDVVWAIYEHEHIDPALTQNELDGLLQSEQETMRSYTTTQ